jgi:nitrous oxidase accessory protein NosD
MASDSSTSPAFTEKPDKLRRSRAGSWGRAACRSGLVVAIASIAGFQSPSRGQQAVPLTAGMVIDRSITIRPGVYRLSSSADLKTPAITIRGQHITIDFNGATLAGSAETADPDTFAGVGMLIDGGSKVTVRNAVIRGYKVGILATHSSDLRLTHNDLSYNWKQRLYSGIEKESLVDWMSYHQNDKDEWLRYGAAMYLSGCDRAEIDHNTAVQGQNGLMVTGSKDLKIWNNTFQFLSAVGVGLYRVTNSTVMHNKIDWCVRGYSHGFYNRGQDSAGLLMYEQSSNNRVAFNSITHGGDGLFLWAGQSTMDTGKGGSNDNAFYRNDFSHAVTNGIEATFSRNAFIENRVEECWHGVWGGYSYDSLWQENRFARNLEGVAIEHGQNNRIYGNTFDGDETAIHLWQNARQDPEWGYPKNRDTRSHGYEIRDNAFRNNKTALLIKDTADVKAAPNRFQNVASRLSVEGATPGVSLDTAPADPPSFSKPEFAPLSGGIDPMIKDGEPRGRETIIVDERGPYDWKSPKLWPAGTPGANPLKLRVLGPPGEWKVRSVRGAMAAPRAGKIPGEIVLTPTSSAAKVIDYDVALEYRGAAVVSPRGARTPAGAPYSFHYSRLFVPIAWRVKLFEYTDASDPVKQPDAFTKLLSGVALKEVRHDRLDYISGASIEDGVPRDNVALVAEGTADLPPGDYVLTVISDDGARVWVDGEEVIDAWSPHESKVDHATIRGGHKKFKVEYYEVGGFAELRFDIQRR